MPTDVLRLVTADQGKTTAIATVNSANFPLSNATDSVSVSYKGIPVESAVNVTATSATVLAANAARKGLILTNLSDTAITIRLDGSAVVATAGLVLNPAPSAGQAGGSVVFDNDVPIGAITAIHASTGNKVLYIMVFN